MMVDYVGLELLKPFQNLVRVLCPRDYAADKPGIGLVNRNCLLSPFCFADHQHFLVDLLKISVYVQGIGGNATDAAVNVCNFHVPIRIPLKKATVNFVASPGRKQMPDS